MTPRLFRLSSLSLAGLAAIGAIAGCPSPDVTEGRWRCQSADDCLDGFVCATRQGACVQPATGEPGLSADTIRVGFVGPLTQGPVELGRSMRNGIEAYFAYINSQGGVDGRELVLETRDDQGDPATSEVALDELLGEDSDVFALLGYANPRGTRAAADKAVEARRLLFAASFGDESFYRDPPDRYVFATRASLAQEVGAFITYGVGARDIRAAPENVGVLAEADSDGVLTALSQQMQDAVTVSLDDGSASPPLPGVFTHRADIVDVDDAVGEALTWLASPERRVNDRGVKLAMIVLGSTPGPGQAFVADILDEFHRIKRGDAPDSRFGLDAAAVAAIQGFNDIIVWAPSSMNTDVTADQLRLAGTFTSLGGEVPYCRQTFTSNVVPDTSVSSTGVLAFKDRLEAFNPAAPADRVALEGYISASLFVEALLAAGPGGGTEDVIDALEAISDLDLGTGQTFDFSASDHVGDSRVFGARLTESCEYDGFDITNVTEPDPGDMCPDGICELRGIIVDDLQLTADFEYVLNGTVFVGDGVNPVALTIDPGVVVRGANGDPTDDDDGVTEDAPGVLIIRPNAQLIASGTPDAPIVFTSEQPEGNRSTGDWGGLVVNGNAPVNNCANPLACPPLGEGGSGIYGGGDPDDSSGVLEYVRVEYGGILINEENELNGIAFQGVGRGTTLDHIQVHRGQDDGVEFFGGTADVKHLYITCADDDSLDWTDGWQGRAQHVVVRQCPGHGDNGIEADNNGDEIDTDGDGETDTAAYRDASPRSSPVLANVTLVGVPDDEGSDYGALLREGTGATFYSSLILGFNDACLDVDHGETFDNAVEDPMASPVVLNGNLQFTNSRFDCASPFEEEDGDLFLLSEFFNTLSTGNALGTIELTAPFDATSPTFEPTGSSGLDTGGVAPSDGWFDDVSHIGAIAPGNDWMTGWTTFEPDVCDDAPMTNTRCFEPASN